MRVACLLGSACAFLLAPVDFVRGGEPSAVARSLAVAPRIDGVLSDGEWEGAREILLPEKNGSRTVVRAAWSGEGLYFAMEATERTPFEREPNSEGSLHTQDVFEIFLDPIGDSRQYYEIQVALSGATFFKNHLLTSEPEAGPEGNFTADFEAREWWPVVIPAPENARAAVRHDPESGVWTVEVFLPASFVNRRRGGIPLQPGPLRLNFARHDWRNPKDADFLYWAPVKAGCPHISPARMGFLHLEQTPGN